MSTSRVKTISTVLDYTASWTANVLTVTTTTPHFLVTGDLVKITSANVPSELIGASVTVTSTTAFTVAVTAMYSQFLSGNVTVPFFRTGQTGRQIFTTPRSTASANVIQSFVTGAGGAVYTIDYSLDGVHWTASGTTITHVTTTNDTQSATIAATWVYAAINITSIGAATSLTVLYSA
jgi:hypothetical protein